MDNKISLFDYIRALRLPFISATVLPFIAGSFLAGHVSFWKFFLGLLCAVCTHIGSNLLNDYADSRTGVDWKDKKFYGFFGGSKLIQQGLVDEMFFLRQAFYYFAAAFICVILLAIALNTIVVIGYYLMILFLGFSYSYKPLAFSYRYLGEIVLFILFGPALVMGAYYLQTNQFPARESFFVAMPFGFFITSILLANEIADNPDDISCGKYNIVGLVGARDAYNFYYILVSLGFVWIAGGILNGYLHFSAWLSFLAWFPILRAGNILRKYCDNKGRLVASSKLAIMVYHIVGIFIIMGLFL